MESLARWAAGAIGPFLALASVAALAGMAAAVARAPVIGWQAAVRRSGADVGVAVAVALIAVLTLGEPRNDQPSPPINLVPFRDVIWGFGGQVELGLAIAVLVANVGLFMPFGMAIAARFPGASVLALVGLAAAVSLIVEVMQAAFVPGRLADVTDVLANAFGGWLGVLIWRGLPPGEDLPAGR